MTKEPGESYAVPPAPRRKFSVGMLALILLLVNAGVTTFVSLAVGSGPQGLALGGLYVFFTIPLILYAVFLAVLSIIGKQGRAPGTFALTVTAAAFLYALYSMAAEGWA
jgi:hypothetical protein